MDNKQEPFESPRFMQVTPENLLIVIQEDMLEHVLYKMFMRFGFKELPELQERDIIDTEMVTGVAKKYLEEKGYRVHSCQAFNALMEQHKIAGVKRGRDKWYPVEQLRNIPARV
jgi:hypothetical protein